MKASRETASPQEYIAALPEDRRAAVQMLDKTIREAAPGLTPHMYGGMLGYGAYRYKYASGREGDGAVVAVASQKNHISIYISTTEAGEYLAEKSKEQLGKVSVGRSCIRFKKIEDLNISGLSDLVQRAAALPILPAAC
jgi:uncharacterized protein YdhG (YjbR/CyaY superfamily)